MARADDVFGGAFGEALGVEEEQPEEGSAPESESEQPAVEDIESPQTEEASAEEGGGDDDEEEEEEDE